MTDEIFFDGIRYVSAADAARESNLTRDYIARLCREGKIRSRRVGKNWYVDHSSLQSFLVAQEHTKLKWQEDLARARAREYKLSSNVPEAAQAIGTRSVSTEQDSLVYSGQLAMHKPRSASPAEETFRLSPIIRHEPRRGHEDLTEARISPVHIPASAVRTLAERTVRSAGKVGGLPAGLPDAALRVIPHTASYALSPAVEFMHKAVAAIVALALTFGTYSLIDPHYAEVLAHSLRDSYSYIESGGIYKIAASAKSQVASAANDPGATFAAVKSYFGKLPKIIGNKLNNFIYAIAFPDALTDSARSGAVTVNIDPYRPRNVVVAQTVQQISSTTTAPRTVIVNNQPVIERVVETQRILAVGGITEEILNEKLNQLDNKLSSQMFSLSAANSTASAQNYQVIAQTNRIDNLASVTITNPTISGGSIAGTRLSNVTFPATTTSTALLDSGSWTINFHRRCSHYQQLTARLLHRTIR